jgi:precorrin-3B synthase
MSAAPSFEVKGWCPGALCPMESGDGLIVRIRPRGGSLARAAMEDIAAASEDHGNGHIDLTRRANLQIRGVRPDTLAPLQRSLHALGLLDATPEVERARNILVSPLSGLDPAEILDMRPLAAEVPERLAADPAARLLPAKFAAVLDGAGRLSLAAERANIFALASRIGDRPAVLIARGGAWLGWTGPQDAAAAICAIIGGRSPGLAEIGNVPSAGAGGTALRRTAEAARFDIELGAGGVAVGLGAPFGLIEAQQLRALAEIAAEIRLSPWRMLYIPAADEIAATRVRAAAARLGLVTGAGDPLMRIQACPGRPACRSAHADTRTEAGRIAAWMATTGFPGTAHVSGCAKGCASSAASDLTLVGVPGGYRFLRNAAARDEGGAFVTSSEIAAELGALPNPAGATRHG